MNKDTAWMVIGNIALMTGLFFFSLVGFIIILWGQISFALIVLTYQFTNNKIITTVVGLFCLWIFMGLIMEDSIINVERLVA